MRKSMVSVIILALFFAIGCSKTPEKAADKFFQEIEKGNLEEAGKYTDSMLYDNIDGPEGILIKTYLSTVKHSNIKVLANEANKAVVQVELSAADINLIVQVVLQGLSELYYSGQDLPPDDEIDKQILDSLTAPDAPKKTMVIDLDMVKLSDKGWVFVANDVLKAGLLLQEPIDEDEFAYDNYDFQVIDTKTVSGTYVGAFVEGVCMFQADGTDMFMECDHEVLHDLEGRENTELTITYDVLSNEAQVGPDDAIVYNILREVM